MSAMSAPMSASNILKMKYIISQVGSRWDEDETLLPDDVFAVWLCLVLCVPMC